MSKIVKQASAKKKRFISLSNQVRKKIYLHSKIFFKVFLINKKVIIEAGEKLEVQASRNKKFTFHQSQSNQAKKKRFFFNSHTKIDSRLFWGRLTSPYFTQRASMQEKKIYLPSITNQSSVKKKRLCPFTRWWLQVFLRNSKTASEKKNKEQASISHKATKQEKKSFPNLHINKSLRLHWKRLENLWKNRASRRARENNFK